MASAAEQEQLQFPGVTFGAWAIGGLFWGGADDEDSIDAIRAGIDHGITAIDTAPIYGCGHSETLVGRAIQGRRDRVLILTKCGLRWDDDTGEQFFTIPDRQGEQVEVYKNVTAKSIFHECEQSLGRLGIETIDLYQVHWPSTTAPAEETMDALNRLRQQGKIRHIGVSNYSVQEFEDARRVAPVATNQVRYNLLERDIEGDILPYCRQQGVAVLAYSPMAMGLLTGKVTMDRQFPAGDIRSQRPWYQPANRCRVLDALNELRPIAQRHNATLAQLCVAWIIAQPGVSTALVGARNARQSCENALAATVKLRADEITQIRTAFEKLGEPQESSE